MQPKKGTVQQIAASSEMFTAWQELQDPWHRSEADVVISGPAISAVGSHTLSRTPCSAAPLSSSARSSDGAR
jgi:hypothetical protein